MRDLRLPLDERERLREDYRLGLFQRRGFDHARAQRLAKVLTFRDRDGDERRVCIECAHWQSAYRNRAAVCAHTRIEVLPDTLQRCWLPFSYQRPA